MELQVIELLIGQLNHKIFREPVPVPIEAPCSKLQGIFDPQGSLLYSNRSLTPQQAAGNALAPGFIALLRLPVVTLYSAAKSLSRITFLPPINNIFFSITSIGTSDFMNSPFFIQKDSAGSGLLSCHSMKPFIVHPERPIQPVQAAGRSAYELCFWGREVL